MFRYLQFTETGPKRPDILRVMPGGVLEERLRKWVQGRLKRGERGTASRLAEWLGRDRSWVTLYSAAAVDADLDTTVRMAAFFKVSLASIIGEAPLPDDATPRLITRDNEQELRAALATLAREILPEQPPARLGETKGGTRTTRGQGRRR